MTYEIRKSFPKFSRLLHFAVLTENGIYYITVPVLRTSKKVKMINFYKQSRYAVPILMFKRFGELRPFVEL